MQTETELQRLAAARPAILDRTQEVVSSAEQDQILRQILQDSRGVRTRPQRRSSHRIIVGISVTAASVAALAAAVLTLGGGRQQTVTTSTPPGHAVRLDAKVVLAKSIRALDQVGDAIEYNHVTGSLNGQPYSGDLWVYRAAERQRLTGPGSADAEAWQTLTGRTLTKGFIYYDSKTWTRYSVPADPGWLAVSRTPTARLEAKFLASVLNTGRWTVTGRTVVDGQDAIVVQVTDTFPGKPGPVPDARRGHATTGAGRKPPTPPAGPLIDVAPSLTQAQYAQAQAHGQTTFTSTGTVTTTLYISAKTLLPIMETDVTHLTSQGVPGSAANQTQSSTFQWLPVTSPNLVLLRPPPIPAGYTKVNPNGQ